MNARMLEASKQPWQFADSDRFAQSLVCLLDQSGQVIRANNTLQRWGAGVSSAANGHSLHDALHVECKVENCYLRHFCDWGSAEIGQGRQVECEVYDPVLNRFFSVHGQPTGLQLEQRGKPTDNPDLLSMIVLEDVTDARIAESRVSALNRELNMQVLRETEKRKKEEAIRLRMQSLVESTSNLVAMTDARGRLTYLNPAGRELLGIDARADVSALLMADLHTDAAREVMLRQAFPAAILNGSWVGKSVLHTPAGTDIETSLFITACNDLNGQHEGFSIVEHDMTAWLKGEQALRESYAQLARLSAELISVQESERSRIAADLHDGIGQSLSLIKLCVSTAVRQLEMGDSADALDTLNNLVPRVCSTIAEVRQVATDLHPSSLDDLGIMATLTWFFREVESACHDIRVDKEFTVKEADIHPSLRIVIFRILQEAVSNILKHANPTCICVKLKNCSDHLLMSIEDDGCGFAPESVVGIDHAGRGFGLSSMKERARLSGGIYTLHSEPGQGTKIRVEWPTENFI